jgi:hypothetical protein
VSVGNFKQEIGTIRHCYHRPMPLRPRPSTLPLVEKWKLAELVQRWAGLTLAALSFLAEESLPQVFDLVRLRDWFIGCGLTSDAGERTAVGVSGVGGFGG